MRVQHLLALVTCGSLSLQPAFAAEKTSIDKGEGAVDIVAWPGYIERGDTNKAYDWVTDFEKKTGCKVNVKTAGTSDEMVALMNEGGFDLVTASGDASSRLIRGKKVAPINVGLLPPASSRSPRHDMAGGRGELEPMDLPHLLLLGFSDSSLLIFGVARLSP